MVKKRIKNLEQNAEGCLLPNGADSLIYGIFKISGFHFKYTVLFRDSGGQALESGNKKKKNQIKV